jgi:hypothetical protein
MRLNPPDRLERDRTERDNVARIEYSYQPIKVVAATRDFRSGWSIVAPGLVTWIAEHGIRDKDRRALESGRLQQLVECATGAVARKRDSG